MERKSIRETLNAIKNNTGSPVSEAASRGVLGSLFDMNTAEGMKKMLDDKIDAPWKSVGISSLGGKDNVSIIMKVSKDAEKDWPHGILHNSRYSMFHIGNDGSIEQFSMNHTLKLKFRKAQAKTMEDVVKKINDYLKKVETPKKAVSSLFDESGS